MLVLHFVFCELFADKSLNLLEYLYVVLGHKSDSFPCPSSTGSSADAMHVIFRAAWDVEVDDHVHRRDVETSRSDVRCYQYVSFT